MRFKKLFGLMLFVVMLFSCLLASSVTVLADDNNGKFFVSTFDTYDDYCCFDMSNKAILSSNKDEKYISEGKGSVKYEIFGTSGSAGLNLASKNSSSNITDIENIEYFSIDVYNDNDFEISFIWVVNSLTSILCSKYLVLEPNQWTTVQLFSDRTKYIDTFYAIKSYGFSFIGKNGSPMNLYLDNFYVVKNTSPVQASNEKKFAENEILFFDDISDLNFVYSNGTATKGRTLNEFSICQIDEFAKSGYSLNMLVRKLTKNVSSTDVWTDGTVNYYPEETGFQIGEDCLNNIKFTDSSIIGIGISVYHDCSTARKVHFSISDLNGKVAQKVMTIEPYTWTEVIIDDISNINRRKVESITFYYEAYQTFQDYNFYFDNLRLVK